MASEPPLLKKLEYLSLVSKVCTEVETHLGFSDKIVAEFITELGRDCESVDVFDAKLKENGADLPDYVVRTLLTVIRSILPLNVKQLDTEITLKTEEEKRFRDKDRCSSGRDGGDERDGRGRRDEYDKDVDNKSLRSGEPELYQVYKGRVQRVMDTGCFVKLNYDQFRGKEGLVHVSQMATRRIINAKDVVKRDQEVYVKVISIANHRLSLSMRDVDQNTGQDLLPLKEDNMTNPSTFNKRAALSGIKIIALSGIKIIHDDDAPLPSCRPLKRMTSLERWEVQQLIASGVLSVKEHLMFDDETYGLLYKEDNMTNPSTFNKRRSTSTTALSGIKIIHDDDDAPLPLHRPLKRMTSLKNCLFFALVFCLLSLLFFL